MVKGHLGDIGPGDDRVDADCPDPLPTEQVIGGRQDSLSRLADPVSWLRPPR